MQAAKLQIAPPAHLCAFVFSSPPIGSQGQMQTTLTCMFTQNIRYSMLKCLLSLCPTCRQTTMPFKGAVFHHSVFYVQMVSVSTQVTSIQVTSSSGLHLTTLLWRLQDPALMNQQPQPQQPAVQVPMAPPAMSNSSADTMTYVTPANIPVGNMAPLAVSAATFTASSGATSQTNVMLANMPAHMVMAAATSSGTASSSGTFVRPQVSTPRAHATRRQQSV